MFTVFKDLCMQYMLIGEEFCNGIVNKEIVSIFFCALRILILILVGYGPVHNRQQAKFNGGPGLRDIFAVQNVHRPGFARLDRQNSGQKQR